MIRLAWAAIVVLIAESAIAAADQSLVAQPQPTVAPPQISALTDRDYLLSLLAERDRQYSQRFDYQERAVVNALTAAKEAVSAALQSAKEAVTKAEVASEKRFESINEFRAQLKDQQQTFMPRSEVTIAIKQLADQLASIAATQVPRSEHETRWASETASISGLQSKLEEVSNRQYTYAGKAEGSSSLWGIIAGAAGLLLAVAALVMAWSQRPKGA